MLRYIAKLSVEAEKRHRSSPQKYVTAQFDLCFTSAPIDVLFRIVILGLRV